MQSSYALHTSRGLNEADPLHRVGGRGALRGALRIINSLVLVPYIQNSLVLYCTVAAVQMDVQVGGWRLAVGDGWLVSLLLIWVGGYLARYGGC